MMTSSDSFSSGSTSGALPYLRAYASTRSYNSIGGADQDGQGEDGGAAAGGAGRGMIAWRAVGAVAVFLAFAAAVSTSNTRWMASGSDHTLTSGDNAAAAVDEPRDGGHSYRGDFETFEERSSGSGAVATAGGGSSSSSRVGSLNLVATNEYGEYDPKALVLYDLDMVVEPFRETRITVSDLPGASSMRFHWVIVSADDSGAPLDSAEPLVDSKGGSFATVTLTQPGTKYALSVQQITHEGTVLAESRTTITCKYVRRELRDLTQEDREAFFSAMREFYTVTREEGREKYGEGFSNAKHMAAYHNSQEYCYHNGMHFLNAHAAFGLWVEQSLQMIDPKVSLAQWDYMVDAAKLGTNWGASEIFSSSMFGSAFGSPENSFQISDGWFANITSIYDPAEDFLNPEEHISATHNPYGFIDATYNYQALPGVLRTYSYCGLEGEAAFTQCDVFIDCFESDSLYDWATCMEDEVHASMHGMIGGGFDCKVDMNDFFENNKQFTRGLLTFTLEFLTANKWPSNKLMKGYNDCDTSCDVDQTEPCGCTCNIDPFEWTDDEVYDFMSSSMFTMTHRAHGERYIVQDESAKYPLGFMQDGERLDDDSAMLLLRQLMVIGCEPGKVGAMATGTSPLDPIFWVLHTGFEKANHILQLSPGFRDTYDFSWVDTVCGNDVSGGALEDLYPFSEKMLGLGDSSELLTNAQIQEILHPSNPKVPYMYEGFQKWGTCTDWDACPECTAAVVASRP